jgi:DNA-binding Xre family transcriptional regulator
MPIEWTLRRRLAVQHGIFSAVQLQTLMNERTGVNLPLRTLGDLLGDTPPASIPIDTLQALCDTLECNFSDFCRIYPDHWDHSPPSLA